MSTQKTQKKLKEHYTLEIPLSLVQVIVENHAKNIFEFIENDKEKLRGGSAKGLVVEVVGSMLPIVETAKKDSLSDINPHF